MRIVQGYPPNIEQIEAAFQVKREPGVIFTFGDAVYTGPGGSTSLSRELVAHEGVHGDRQMSTGPLRWWKTYCEDPEFRFKEELPAHVAEYREFCRHVADPNKRARFLFNVVAARLSSRLYGNLVGHVQARKLIKEAR